MLTGIWIWSGHASASIISNFFSLHGFFRISPISFDLSVYFFSSVLWCKYNVILTSISLNGLCVLLHFSLVLPPDILCDAAAKPSPLYHEVLLLLKLFFAPGRTGGCFQLKRQNRVSENFFSDTLYF